MALSSQTGLNYISKLCLVLLISLFLPETEGNLLFSGCDKNGWKCIPAKGKVDKYDLELDCNSSGSVAISLWNFRAPKEIFGLKIKNCLYLEVDFSCGSDGHLIDSLYIYNIEYLNLTSATHAELSLIPNKFVIENIGRIFKIPSYLIKQTMDFPTNLFKCSVQGVPVDTLFFSDIGYIDVIEHHGINLTDMAWFTWHNVTVNDIEPLGMHVMMAKNKQFTIEHSNLNRVGYRGIRLRAYSIFFNKTDIFELEKFGIRATVYWFDFTNSKIGLVHTRGFHLLAQNVNIMNNTFTQLEPRSFYGIGPGLLENALVSFGRLRFTYVFSKNKILQANVGSLNPDWEAYKNVKTFMNFTLNYLPCSCSEIGWINLDDGIGGGFTDTVSFNNKIMERKSQNMCVDAPCLLPFGVMTIMHFVNGTCGRTQSLKEVCNKFINNKDFRIGILSATEQFLRRPLPHARPTEEILRPIPIVPLKGNMLMKKTEYLNDFEDLEQSQSNSIDRDFRDDSDKIPDFAINSIVQNKKRYKQRKHNRHPYNRYVGTHEVDARSTEQEDNKEVFDSELISHQIFDKTALNIKEILRRHARSVDPKDGGEPAKGELVNNTKVNKSTMKPTEDVPISTNPIESTTEDDPKAGGEPAKEDLVNNTTVNNSTVKPTEDVPTSTNSIESTTEDDIVYQIYSNGTIEEVRMEDIPEIKDIYVVTDLLKEDEIVPIRKGAGLESHMQSHPSTKSGELEVIQFDPFAGIISGNNLTEEEQEQAIDAMVAKFAAEIESSIDNGLNKELNTLTNKSKIGEATTMIEMSSTDAPSSEQPTTTAETSTTTEEPTSNTTENEQVTKVSTEKSKKISTKSYPEIKKKVSKVSERSTKKTRTVDSVDHGSGEKYMGKPGKLKVEWKMVPTGMDKEKNPVAFVPKIVESYEDKQDDSDFRISEDEVKERWEVRERAETTPEPIVVGAYRNIKHKPGDRISIHEQITNIAEKLTKEFGRQLKERQRQDMENARKIDIKLSSLEGVENPVEYDDYDSFMSMYNNHQATSTEGISKLEPVQQFYRTEDSDEDWTPEIHLAKRITKNESDMNDELEKIKESLSDKYKNQTFPITLAHDPNKPHK